MRTVKPMAKVKETPLGLPTRFRSRIEWGNQRDLPNRDRAWLWSDIALRRILAHGIAVAYFADETSGSALFTDPTYPCHPRAPRAPSRRMGLRTGQAIGCLREGWSAESHSLLNHRTRQASTDDVPLSASCPPPSSAGMPMPRHLRPHVLGAIWQSSKA